ncbi:MAG TPA: DUF441 domain-containing protein [Firmicutes bacterium]|nr:DUF441 domain-containing protein [Bacillota bacterium]
MKKLFKANLLLLVFLVVGLVFGNSLVAASAGSLLVMKLLNSSMLMKIVERHALQWGLLFLLIAVMVPLTKEKIGGKELLQIIATPAGLVAIIGGIAAAYLCGQGLGLLHIKPEVMVGLVIGTVLGVSFFKGVPVGPLAAAGLTAVLLKLLGLVTK